MSGKYNKNVADEVMFMKYNKCQKPFCVEFPIECDVKKKMSKNEQKWAKKEAT